MSTITKKFAIYINVAMPSGTDIQYRVQLSDTVDQAGSSMNDDIHIKIDGASIKVDEDRYEVVKMRNTTPTVEDRAEKPIEKPTGSTTYTTTYSEEEPEDVKTTSQKEQAQALDTTPGAKSGQDISAVDADDLRQQQQASLETSPLRKRIRELDDNSGGSSPHKRAKMTPEESVSGEEDMEMTDDSEEEAEDPDALYCRCKEGDDGTPMVGCDGEDSCRSNGWVHWRCISTKLAQPGDDAETWLCPDCEPAPKKKKQAKAYSWTRAAITKGAAAKRREGTEKRGTAAEKRRLFLW